MRSPDPGLRALAAGSTVRIETGDCFARPLAAPRAWLPRSVRLLTRWEREWDRR